MSRPARSDGHHVRGKDPLRQEVLLEGPLSRFAEVKVKDSKDQPALVQQGVPLGQLMRIPGREPMPDRLLADLVFRHRRNDLVVHQ